MTRLALCLLLLASGASAEQLPRAVSVPSPSPSSAIPSKCEGADFDLQQLTC